MRRWMGALSCAVVLGCPSVDKDPIVTESAGTIAVFAPDSADRCNSVMPYPTDLSKDVTTGLLDVPFCEDDTADLIAFKAGLNTLDGYSINTVLTVNFNKPIDEATVDGSITIVNTTNGLAHPIAVTLFDEDENLLTIVPARAFDEGTTYMVFVSNDLRASGGGEVISDQVFTLLKSDTPLVDGHGYSTIALDDATANALELLRTAYQPIFDAALLPAAGSVAKEDLLVAWSFTTQSVTSTYSDLALMVGGATAELDSSLPAAAHPLLSAAGIPTDSLCDIHSGRITLDNLLGDNGMFARDATGALQATDEVVDYLLFTPNPACQDVDSWNGVVVFAHSLGSCKNAAVTVANTFGMFGWATLALDGPRAGGRTLGNLGDQDLDTCPDQPATPELIALGDETPNPFGISDRLRQWGLELVQAVELVNTNVRVLTEAVPGDPPTTAPAVALFGHSWGGMAAVLAGQVSPYVDAIAVSAASGGLGKVFEPLLEAGIRQSLIDAGLSPSTPGFDALVAEQLQTVASIYTWALEPADPLYAAQNWGTRDVPVLAQVVAAPAPDPGAALHFTSTQTNLATVFAERDDTFELADVTATVTCGADEPVCDDSLGVVAEPLVPCDGDYAYAATAWTGILQTQLATFITMGTPPTAPTAPTCTAP